VSGISRHSTHAEHKSRGDVSDSENRSSTRRYEGRQQRGVLRLEKRASRTCPPSPLDASEASVTRFRQVFAIT